MKQVTTPLTANQYAWYEGKLFDARVRMGSHRVPLYLGSLTTPGARQQEHGAIWNALLHGHGVKWVTLTRRHRLNDPWYGDKRIRHYYKLANKIKEGEF